MFSSINSFGLVGISCYPVAVEVDVSRAFPCFEIVGLPDAAVKESKDRVRSALKNCGIDFPDSRVVVNLAPANTKKTGAYYDLPILIGILCSIGLLEPVPEQVGMIGELSLDGKVRPVKGVLSMVSQARSQGFSSVIVPMENAAEGAVFPDIQVYAAQSVRRCWPTCGENRPCPWPGSSPPGPNPSRIIWTFPMSGASSWPSGRWRWRLPAATTSCCWAPPGRARA